MLHLENATRDPENANWDSKTVTRDPENGTCAPKNAIRGPAYDTEINKMTPGQQVMLPQSEFTERQVSWGSFGTPFRIGFFTK